MSLLVPVRNAHTAETSVNDTSYSAATVLLEKEASRGRIKRICPGGLK